ncbi:hypothetical protein Poly30_28280 [Planctomycetes bacterium Poly30]|uniref:DUF2971 domain-containing protein n=1 Tax=Saltatorellus ferox TaxID=2528018 RepID=A0A518ETA6_9BACT|nr:hypothetical protein Poly30_28280 [Planctomycetes bacterium Poly30]
MQLVKFRRSPVDDPFTVALLRTSEVFLGGFESFNDPREGIYNSRNDEWSAHENAVLLEKRRIRIGCFSDGSRMHTDRGYDLMWAHYADSFKGVAIQLRFNKELSEKLREVNYVEWEELDREQRQGEGAGLSPEDLLTRKSRLWSYEKEHRLLIHSDDLVRAKTDGLREDSSGTFARVSIDKVLAGCRATSETIDRLNQIRKDVNGDWAIEKLRSPWMPPTVVDP